MFSRQQPRPTRPSIARRWLSLARSAPIEAAAALVLLCYLTIGLTRPSDVLWSTDQGAKLLEVVALLDGRLDLSLAYSNRAIDPELAFRPFVHSFVRDGAILVNFPLAFILPSAVLFSALGGFGLLLLPLAGGALAAWAAGRLAEGVSAGSGVAAVLMAGLATPLLVYSSLFWEHAPAAGLFGAGLVLAAPMARPGAVRLVCAGLSFGLALAWRNETVLYLAAAALAALPLCASPERGRQVGWLLVGLLLIAVPSFGYNWLSTGRLTAGADVFNPSLERVAQNVVRYFPSLPADLLVGARDFGFEPPDLVRWLPAAGLLALAAARVLRPRPAPILRLLGMSLVASASAMLLLSPPPDAVHGLLISAPFLALSLLVPRELLVGPSGRVLERFALLALPIFAAAAIFLHLKGTRAGGLEWGPRYLLPLYPPLVALAAASLHRVSATSGRLELLLARSLVLLGLAFQLVGMLQIDHRLREWRSYGELLAGLPPAPIVIRPNFLVQTTPGLTRALPVSCAETPAALRSWLALALAAGQVHFWYVDWGPLPSGWLLSAADVPRLTAQVKAGALWATRYESAAAQQALRPEGIERESCGYLLRD